jgi:internalin A
MALSSPKKGLAEAEVRIDKALALQSSTLDLSGLGLADVPALIIRGALLFQRLVLRNNRLTTVPEPVGELTQLQELHLQHNELTRVPEIIGKLDKLQQLYLNDNAIGKVSEAIGQLKELKELYLNNNRLTAVPASIVRLDKLRDLHLHNNKLAAVPDHIGRLTKLRELHLQYNELTRVPETIGKLDKLQQLYLHENSIGYVSESIGQLKELRELYLNNNRLTTVPASIVQLENLEELYFHNNQLAAVPDNIGRLTKLRELYLHSNQLTAVPKSIGQLTQLTILRLGNNNLTAVPDTIGRLEKLEKLYLHDNQLTAVPDAIGQLARLQELHLDTNRLIALPETVGQLTKLQQLHLDFNDLTTLPEGLEQLKSLTVLYLHFNRGLLIPPEALGPTWEDVNKSGKQAADPRTVLAAYRDSRGETSRPMCEAKLLLVGPPRVGKTSLVRRLVHSERCGKDEKPTLGISREPWLREIKPPNQRTTQSVTLNVWDLGGQEIMHATHQFFLTRRSLYLIVLDAATTDAEKNLVYWLKLIRSFASDARVLVVVNKIDYGLTLELNKTRLKKDYPNIVAFCAVSCDTGYGIATLKKQIDKQIGLLHHVFDPVAPSFFKIKQQVKELAEKASYITRAEYEDVCATAGEISDADRNRFLRFLHDLGIALNFDDPEDPYQLNDTNVLDPEWVSDAVYRIITSAELKSRDGVLVRSDLGRILGDIKRFPPEQHEFILELMRKFELCFDFPDSNGDQFLVPECLGKVEPNVGWDEEHSRSSLNLRIRYDVLPPGLVCRFIVKMYTHLIPAQPGRAISRTYWRDGAVLHIHKNRCLVRGSADEGLIYIQVQGPEDTRREALAILRKKFDDIHHTIRELKVVELVPVPDQQRVTVEHPTLVRMLMEGIERFVPDGAFKPESATELLKRVDTPQRSLGYSSNGKQIHGDPGKGDILLGSRSPEHDQRPITVIETRWSPHDLQPIRTIEIQDLNLPVDFGIITVKSEEMSAVERRFQVVTRVVGKKRDYSLAHVDTPTGVRTALIAKSHEQGQKEAQLCASNLIEEANPPWLLLVGIAGAFPAPEFTLGDVLVASRIHDFSVTAALAQGIEWNVGGGPVHREVKKLIGPLQGVGSRLLGDWNGPAAISMSKPQLTVPKDLNDSAFYGDQKWREKVRSMLLEHFPSAQPKTVARQKHSTKTTTGYPESRRPLFRTEPVITGDTLVKNPSLVEEWKQIARAAAHVEMELGGVVTVAEQNDVPVVSIRGLSDIVGYVRSTAWTEYACQTAAAFARALVGSGLIDTRRNDQRRRTPR